VNVDKGEATSVLERQLGRYRGLAYAELLALLGEAASFEVVGPGGTAYQVEIDAVWDDGPGGDLRIIGMIDDGGWWHGFAPLSSDFIISPDGSFVGE
jgi:hypothetical protein